MTIVRQILYNQIINFFVTFNDLISMTDVLI